MSEPQKGLVAVLAANLLWGLFPLYWLQLDHVPPVEVLAHRTFWSMFIFVCWMAIRGRLHELWSVLATSRSRWRIIGAATAITGNWFFFIYAVQTGAVMEASIGYYIFPLMAVSVGFLLFRERLSPPQWFAVALASVAVLTLTVGLGVVPWLSLILASCFTFYGAFKRGVTAGPILSVTAEVSIVGPLSLIWILGVHMLGWTDFTGREGGFFGQDLTTTVLFVLSGFVTAVPLMLFSYAARRITYSTIGLMQYTNPTIQFVLAVWYFGQAVTIFHMIALPLIWIGLAIYSISTIRLDRERRRAASRSPVP